MNTETVQRSLENLPEGVRREFARLAETWRTERGSSSSMTKFIMHPAYQRIIGMGLPVVPLILKELEKSPDHWFWALRCITGKDPVPVEHAGHLRQMSEDWLKYSAGARVS